MPSGMNSYGLLKAASFARSDKFARDGLGTGIKRPTFTTSRAVAGSAAQSPQPLATSVKFREAARSAAGPAASPVRRPRLGLRRPGWRATRSSRCSAGRRRGGAPGRRDHRSELAADRARRPSVAGRRPPDPRGSRAVADRAAAGRVALAAMGLTSTRLRS